MQIESVKAKYEDYLMSLPNVIGVGIGEKAGKEAIIIYVTQKVPASALQPQEVIPKYLEGWNADRRAPNWERSGWRRGIGR